MPPPTPQLPATSLLSSQTPAAATSTAPSPLPSPPSPTPMSKGKGKRACIFPDCRHEIGLRSLPAHIREFHPEVAAPGAMIPGAPGYERIHDALDLARRWRCVTCGGVNSPSAGLRCKSRVAGNVCHGPRYIRGNHNTGEQEPEPALVGTPSPLPPAFSSTALDPGSPEAFAELSSHRSRTMLNVPAGALEAWTAALLSTLTDVWTHPTEPGPWFHFLCLPKLILAHAPRSPSRAVRQHAPSTTAYVKARLALWSQGEGGRQALLLERLGQLPDDGPRARLDWISRSLTRCKTLAACGRLGDAAQALGSGHLAIASPANAAVLAALHPTADLPPRPSLAPPPPFAPTGADVLSALKSFKRRTACGASGLYVEHLLVPLTKLTEEKAASLLAALHRVCALLAAGKAPEVVLTAITTAPIAALTKATGGLRPIAIGEVMRRLTSRLAVQHASPAVQAYFQPHQVGVGTRGGAEAVVHAAQALVLRLGSDSSIALLKVDLRNAFNMVDRGTFFAAVRTHCPGISAWVEACYGRRNPLLFGAHRLQCSTGVQQGDPLGPLLFALALQPLVARIQETVAPLLNAWYLDDGALVGTPNQLASALCILRELGPASGLHLNLAKCELWWPQLDINPLADLSLPLVIQREAGVELLGAPLGATQFAETYVGRRVESIACILERARLLEDPQLQLTLIRQCILYPRFNHALRTCNPRLIPRAIQAFDRLSDDALTSIIGPLTVEARAQAALPPCEGGLGIPTASDRAAPAFIASVDQTRREQGALLGPDALLRPDFDAAWSAFCASHPHDPPLSLSLLHEASAKPQQWLSAIVDAAARHRAFEAAQALPETRTLARLNSLRLPHNAAWLLAPPLVQHRIEPHAYRLLLRYRLGLPIRDVVENSRCPACPAALDPWGDHVASCAGPGGRKARHNRLRDALASVCKPLFPRDGGVATEPSGLLPSHQQLYPADVLLRGLGLTAIDRACCVDVSIVNSCAPSHLQRAAKSAGMAMSYSVTSKQAKYEVLCEAQGLDYLPFLMEAFGGLQDAPKPKKLLRLLGERRQHLHGGDLGTAVSHVMMQLSVASMRALGHTLRARYEAPQSRAPRSSRSSPRVRATPRLLFPARTPSIVPVHNSSPPASPDAFGSNG
jgi:hypothetical protein